MENWNQQQINSQYINKRRLPDGFTNIINPSSIRSGIEMVILTSGYTSTTVDTNDVTNIAEALIYQGHEVRIITCRNNHVCVHQCGIANKIMVQKINTYIPRPPPHTLWNFILNGPCFLLNSALLALWMLIFFTTGTMMIPQQNPQIVLICDTHPISVLILKCFGNFRIIYFHKFRNITISRGKIELRDTHYLPQWIIRFCLYLSDEIVVENNASARLFCKVFSCKRQKILYPCVVTGRLLSEECGSIKRIIPKLEPNTHIILAYGYFNKSSNFELAIDAFDLAYRKNNQCKYAEHIKLVIAGNYCCSDNNQFEYYKHLVKYACLKKSAADIFLVTSLSSVKKKTLLSFSLVLLHTYFYDISARQILEAMYVGTPVISDYNNVSKDYLPDEYGCLVKPTPKYYARAIINLLRDHKTAQEYGNHVKMHFIQHFSFLQFSNQLSKLVNGTEDECNDCCQSMLECYSKLFED